MTDPRAPRPVRGALAVAVGTVLAAVLASGCATLPSSGQPQSFAVRPAQGVGILPGSGVLVQAPRPGWPPSEVVRNFLLASTNFAHNYHLAREYLTTDASRAWHPGSQVTILSGVKVTQQPGRVSALEGKATVLVTWHELATLSSNGQYIPQGSKAAKALSEQFIVQSVNGTEKIAQLPGPSPSRELLLTSDLFHLAYTPQDLYYYGVRSGLLLPDPVYAPIQGTNPVTTLVDDLRHRPAGLLGGAARTYLPEDARLTGVQVAPGPSGKTATVNITLPDGGRGVDVAKMAVQLVSTLTSPVFSSPLFHAVRLRIDGHLWPAQNLGSYQWAFPHVHRNLNAYYLAQNGSIRMLGPSAQHGGRALPNAAGVNQPALSQVAVSPDGKYLAGIGGPATTVYTGGLVPAAKPGQPATARQLYTQLTGNKFTSLSWDRDSDLWIAGKMHHHWGLWVLVHGQGILMPVNVPGHNGQPITGLRVAPDGVRVAMIFGQKARAQVWLAAATRGLTGGFDLTPPVPLGGQGGSQVLTRVTSLTWYDEDHLLAVAGRPSATQLWEVPVDGDNPTSLGPLPGIASVTAAGPGNPFYLGLTDGQLERAVGPNQLLQGITAGQAPSYPG